MLLMYTRTRPVLNTSTQKSAGYSSVTYTQAYKRKYK